MIKNEKGLFIYASWEDVLTRVAGVVRTIFNICSVKLISKAGHITMINMKTVI